ncbi:MAG: heparinase II/III family protein [Victivallales bacterium]|nr:heparinase II/III family protein [Victivallales bacterium]
MKKTLCCLLVACGCVVSGASLYHPSKETKAKIKADVEYQNLLRRAERELGEKPIDPNGTYGTGKGRDVGFWPRAVGIPLIRWMENLGYAYLVSGEKKYADKGVALLVQTAKDFPVETPNIQRGMCGARGHITYGLILGTMLFEDCLTTEQKDLLEQVTKGYVKDYLKYFDDPKSGLYHTANWTALNGGPAGMACIYWRSRPEWPELLARVIDTQKGWLEHAFDEQGLYAEGYQYSRYGMTPRLITFAWLLREAGMEDLFKLPKLRKLPEALIKILIPGSQQFDDRGDSDYTTAGLECLFLAVANQDETAMWLWEHSDRVFRTFPLDYLVSAFGTPEPKLDLAKYPLSVQFKQREFANWRTGWGKDDVLFSIESGKQIRTPGGIATGHGQSDRGSFCLFAFGQKWLPDSGYGNDPGHKRSRTRSEAHNMILIDGQGEARAHVDGTMTDYFDSPAYGYSRSDVTGAYVQNIRGQKALGPAAARVVRQTVFARPTQGIPAYAVVLDDFQPQDNAEHEYTWNSVVFMDKTIRMSDGRATLRRNSIPKVFATTYPKPDETKVVIGTAEHPEGTVDWTISVTEEGDYAFWYLARPGGDYIPRCDSFWLVLNDNQPILLDLHASNKDYNWQWLNRPAQANALAPSEPVAVPLRLKKGENHLKIHTRERRTELYAVYLSNDGSSPLAPSDKGIYREILDAKISGRMQVFQTDLEALLTSGTTDRMELFADGVGGAVKFSTVLFHAPNPRPPLTMQLLKGKVRAVNPYFTAVMIPLHKETPTPVVKTERTPAQITVMVQWPQATDTVTWPVNADGSTGKATFLRK